MLPAFIGLPRLRVSQCSVSPVAASPRTVLATRAMAIGQASSASRPVQHHPGAGRDEQQREVLQQAAGGVRRSSWAAAEIR
jgi:hypothetical protein